MKIHYCIGTLGGVKIKTQREALLIDANLKELYTAFMQGVKVRYKYGNCQVQTTESTVKLYMNHNKLIASYNLSDSNEIFVDLDVNDFGFSGYRGGSGFRKAVNFNEVLPFLEMLTGFTFGFKDGQLFYFGDSQKVDIENHFKININHKGVTISKSRYLNKTALPEELKDSIPFKKSIGHVRVKRIVSEITGKELIQLFVTDENTMILINGRKVY